MATGRVLQFDPARGYGFVAAEDGGEDIFLHASVFDGDPDSLAPGTKVEFNVMAGDRGRKAFAARILDGDADLADKPGPAVRPNPSVMPPHAPITASPAGLTAEPSPERSDDTTDEEQMCDVLPQLELAQEITELLISHVPTLTGQQIIEIRHGVLDVARKHGWVDI